MPNTRLRNPKTGHGVCPWGPHALSYAAGGGQLETMKWLRDPNTGGGICPWSHEAVRYAARGGHEDVLMYLYEQKAPYPTIYFEPSENCKNFLKHYGPLWAKGEFQVVGGENIKG